MRSTERHSRFYCTQKKQLCSNKLSHHREPVSCSVLSENFLNLTLYDDSRNCRNCYPVSDTDVQVKCLVHYYSTTTTAATTTTKNVRIIVLPSHSCGGTLQGLHLKLLHSSTQTSADGLNGQRQVSRMTDEKGETKLVSLRNVKSARVSGGRLFHARTAATEKARSPRVTR